MGGAQWGGSEALWYHVAMHALKEADDVFISVYDWGTPNKKLTELQVKGATIHYRKRYNSEAGATEKIKRFIRKRNPSLDIDYQSIIAFKPDAVFISQGDSFDLAIHHRPLYELLLKHSLRYYFVCHSHAQYSFIPTREIYPGAVDVFKNANTVFFVSHRQWRLTERRLAMKIDNGRFTWNPLDFQPPATPLPWPALDVLQLAIVGSVDGSKGQDTALESLSKPQWKARQWILNIYGEGYGQAYLRKLAEFYGISNRIVFHGHVTNVEKIWETNHIILIPSAGEGLPISLVEAMACGRPAVVTDVGGNVELITDVENGFVAHSPTAEAFLTALENAWLRKNDLQRIGQNAFNKINAVLEKSPEIKIYELLKDAE